MAMMRQFRVLNVDDYQAGLYAKSRALREAGFEVIEAGTGAEAIRKAETEAPDLALLDVHLPDMSGIQVSRHLKAGGVTASILILQISATYTGGDTRVEALDAGADSYMVEPVEPRELVANVRALLRLRAAEEQVRASAAEAEDRRREAETFAALASAMSASLDLEPTLHAIGRATRTLCRCDFAWLALRDSESGDLAIRYRVDDDFRLYDPPHRLPLGPGLGAEVMRTGRPVRSVYGAGGAPGDGADDLLARTEGVGAVLAVPVQVYGRLAGLIYALNRAPEAFGAASELTLERIASHAALAIRNSQLFTREQAARADAETANRAKDQFLAVLSHELRTPLQPIIGWVHVVRSTGFERSTVIHALEVIERNIRAQTQLVDDLLDVSGIINGKLRLEVEVIALPRVVEAAVEVVRPAANAKAVTITTSLGAASPVMGDAARLQQVVWNLLSNAVKFTPRGGTVDVTLDRVSSHVEIAVKDTGQGIARDFLPYVFDRFRQADSSTTRKAAGLGLGLAIVRHLVELHGGTVAADSPGEDQGATFSVRLPVLAIAPAETAGTVGGAPSSVEVPSIAGVRVLVVDDQPDGRELMRVLLAGAGAVVDTASSADEALAALARFSPDVILADLEMPGTDGYALIREIRARSVEQGGHTPAAAISAHVRPPDRTRALAAGFQTHIAKPATPTEVLATVAALSGRPWRALTEGA
jgi:signal transduction histidine kinase/DNA-binding response OmpR family regulator